MKQVLAQANIPTSQSVFSGWKFNSVGDIFSDVLKYAIALGGLAMFASLVMGGFSLLTSGGQPEKIKQGTQKILFGVVGFLIIFSTYWILQLVELIFGLQIL